MGEKAHKVEGLAVAESARQRSMSDLQAGRMRMLYVTRHGQTTWNVANKMCGRTDAPLTDEGREQARRLGQSLKEDRVHFDRIIASPLARAKATAQLVAEQLDFPMDKLETDPRLMEISFGQLEGVQMDSDEHLAYKTQFAFSYPEGESILSAANRIYPVLEELQADAKARMEAGQPEQNVLLVCHGGTARVINSFFNDLSNEAFFFWSLNNAEPVVYQL